MRRSALAFVLCCCAAGWVTAAPGDLVQNVNLPVDGFGVSVGVDCNGNVYYTLDSDSNLYKMDKDGNLLDTIPVGSFFDEISWDNGRGVFWAVLHGSNPVDVYTIDPTTGNATFKFTSSTNSIGTFRDGLAYDASDDSLWISGDVSTTVEHHAADGTNLGAITPKTAAGGNLGNISGVFAGVGDLLYLGQDGSQMIVQVKKSDGSFIADFASPGGARDEGLECDSVNFAPLTVLWSREFNTPGFISVIELAPGSCFCGGAPEPTPTGTPGTPTPSPTATPRITPTPPQPVPTNTPTGLFVLAGLLAAAGVFLLLRRLV